MGSVFDEVFGDAHADLCSGDIFGTEVTVSRPGGASFVASGVLQEGEEDVQGNAQVVSTDVHSISLNAADCDFEPEEGDQVTADGRTWHVYDVREEGQGVLRLELHETT